MSAIAQPRWKRAKSNSEFSQAILRFASGLAMLLLLWSGWWLAARPVWVTVDGVAEQLSTHRRTVAALLLDLDLELHPQDRITPPLDAPVTRNLHLVVERARPFLILADGREVEVASWGQSVRQLLKDAQINVDPYDRVLVGGRSVGLDEPLPPPVTIAAAVTYDRGYDWERYGIEPTQLRLQRAIPITVDDGGLPFTLRTTAETVGEALRQAEITLYLGDRVWPTLGSQLNTGLRVQIQRSRPITLQVDGRLIKTRTQAKTVADALAELKIGLAGSDMVEPALEHELVNNVRIRIVRVHQDVEIEDEIIPFETLFEPDPNLALDTQQVVNPGAPGINRQRYHVRYEDGQEVARTLQDSWVAQEETQRVIAYGQRIAPQTFTAPDGSQITYWRKLRMYATSYSAATAGVSRDSPTYGRTFTGELMRTGIVAVDPRVIPLRSRVYVPGYGIGDALDRGSAVLGRHIDLGFADDELQYWTRWVDVYLLWPPPPSHQITWVLPNYPRE